MAKKKNNSVLNQDYNKTEEQNEIDEELNSLNNEPNYNSTFFKEHEPSDIEESKAEDLSVEGSTMEKEPIEEIKEEPQKEEKPKEKSINDLSADEYRLYQRTGVIPK